MKAAAGWLASTGAAFGASDGYRGRAQLRNYSVDYREWGSGPPLVLVPGLAGGLGLLAPLAQALASHFRVIAYELRGEDDCFALRTRFGLADLADDLLEFIDWQRLERPTVMGISFGGLVSLECAIRYPSRLGGLVVQGVGARFETGLLQQVAGVVLARYPLPADNPFINQFFQLLFGGRRGPDALFHFVTKQCWQTDQSVMAYRFQLAEKVCFGESLRRIVTPTLILTGTKDLLVSERGAADLHRQIPGSSSTRLEGCGHLACVTHAKRLAEEVHAFAQSHRARPPVGRI